MEYILIFITAIFVNNIVLSQFLGICPFLGVSKKVETAMGMGAAVAFVLTLGLFADHCIYPCHCGIGSDGGNYFEESFSGFVSGSWSILTVDYNKLLYLGCDYSGYSEEL